MMMISNSPTPMGPAHIVGAEGGNQKMMDELASFAKMISLPPGIEKPLCADSAQGFRNSSGYEGCPTAGLQGGSPEYWQRLDEATSEDSPVLSDSSWAPASPQPQGFDKPQFRPRPTTLGSPVPVQGSVPITTMQAAPASAGPAPAASGSAATAQFNQFEKPPYSFPCLIGLALQSVPTERMSVAQIYEYVCHHFPYFRTAKAGWKNSIRHNLSLNKFFCKLERRENEQGKGSMWGIVPENKEQLNRDITACQSRYPTKFRAYHEAAAAAHQHGQHQRPAMPPAPPPKGVGGRARSSPMIFTGAAAAMANSRHPAPESRRVSLPAQLPDFTDCGLLDADDFDCLPMIKADPDDMLLMGGSEMCWIGDNDGGSSASSSPGADQMDVAEGWLPIPEDLSAYISTAGGGGGGGGTAGGWNFN